MHAKSMTAVLVEKKLHIGFGDHRVNSNREFFDIEPERVVAILELLTQKEITEEVNEEMSTNITDDDRSSSERLKRKKRPQLNFTEMGIPIGSTLVYQNDPSIKAVVREDRKIEYGDDLLSLTALTQAIQGVSYPVGPTPFWSYNGRKLLDIYNDTYNWPEA